jgi:30S ribosomal protein S31
MGKGDKKTKRGKIINGSYGARRPRKIKKTLVPQLRPAENEEKQKEVKSPPARKKIRTTASH